MASDPSPYAIRVDRGSAVANDPGTSIIILVTKDTTMLRRCLRTVAAAGSPDDRSEVIVVANGTSEGALAAVESRQDIVLIRSPVNHGFAGGCNLAVRCARGERLVFLNDDAAVTPGWLGGLHRALDADRYTAVAGSKVLLREDRLQEAGCVLWRDGRTSGVGRGRLPREQEFSFSRPVDYVSFCSAMVRREAWTEADGFDERYFPAYYEDVDLCLALRQLGWGITYEATSVVLHSEGGSATPDYRAFLSRRNHAAFVAKWASVLHEYDPPPVTEADRRGSVQRALRRSAERPLPSRTTASGTQRALPALDAFDDLESLALDVRHLLAAMDITGEYIEHLQAEASRVGIRDVVRRRLRRRLVQFRERVDNRGRPEGTVTDAVDGTSM